MGFLRLVVGILVSSWVLSARTESVKHLAPCKFPAIYNFGDSNSDTGGISAAFSPAGPPCGETFFHKPAGRGSDGRLIIDFFAQHLKFPLLGAYLDSLAPSFRHGANFATGGATIRWQNKTQREGVSPFSLDVQIGHYYQFKTRSSDMYKAAGQDTGSGSKGRLPRPEDFANALYTFDIGQNDLAAGFQQGSEQLRASMPDIVDQLVRAIQQLYDQGARTFWIHNTGPIGCLPVTTHYYHDPTSEDLDQAGCVKSQNEMAQEFNRKLKERVTKLRTQLPYAAITYVDVFAAKSRLIGSAKAEAYVYRHFIVKSRLTANNEALDFPTLVAHRSSCRRFRTRVGRLLREYGSSCWNFNVHNVNPGFVAASKICCGYHEDSIHVYCGNKAKLNGTEIYADSCEDPSSYISWDGVHYTEAANHWLASHLVNGSFSDPPVPIAQACHRLS